MIDKPREGDWVVAIAGLKEGQIGKVVLHGVHVSWIRWKGGAVTTYPHSALDRYEGRKRAPNKGTSK